MPGGETSIRRRRQKITNEGKDESRFKYYSTNLNGAFHNMANKSLVCEPKTSGCDVHNKIPVSP